MSTIDQTEAKLQRYYNLHAKIYDLTRWTFLFGRKTVIEHLPTQDYRHVAEVGCGTGVNLRQLHQRFPHAELHGYDLASAMIHKAQKRFHANEIKAELYNQPYTFSGKEPRYDLILFSYCLSMINPGWDTVLEDAKRDLKPGGVIAIVDFFDSPVSSFRSWMGVNHVRMQGHLQDGLSDPRFEIIHEQRHKAYLGLWRYLLWIARKK